MVYKRTEVWEVLEKVIDIHLNQGWSISRKDILLSANMLIFDDKRNSLDFPMDEYYSMITELLKNEEEELYVIPKIIKNQSGETNIPDRYNLNDDE